MADRKRKASGDDTVQVELEISIRPLTVVVDMPHTTFQQIDRLIETSAGRGAHLDDSPVDVYERLINLIDGRIDDARIVSQGVPVPAKRRSARRG